VVIKDNETTLYEFISLCILFYTTNNDGPFGHLLPPISLFFVSMKHDHSNDHSKSISKRVP
jgi:hypothetical protein